MGGGRARAVDNELRTKLLQLCAAPTPWASTAIAVSEEPAVDAKRAVAGWVDSLECEALEAFVPLASAGRPLLLVAYATVRVGVADNHTVHRVKVNGRTTVRQLKQHLQQLEPRCSIEDVVVTCHSSRIPMPSTDDTTFLALTRFADPAEFGVTADYPLHCDIHAQRRTRLAEKQPLSRYQIFVKTLTGGTITLDVSSHDAIEAINAKVDEQLDLDCDSQRLIFAGKGSLPPSSLSLSCPCVRFARQTVGVGARSLRLRSRPREHAAPRTAPPWRHVPQQQRARRLARPACFPGPGSKRRVGSLGGGGSRGVGRRREQSARRHRHGDCRGVDGGGNGAPQRVASRHRGRRRKTRRHRQQTRCRGGWGQHRLRGGRGSARAMARRANFGRVGRRAVTCRSGAAIFLLLSSHRVSGKNSRREATQLLFIAAHIRAQYARRL